MTSSTAANTRSAKTKHSAGTKDGSHQNPAASPAANASDGSGNRHRKITDCTNCGRPVVTGTDRVLEPATGSTWHVLCTPAFDEHDRQFHAGTHYRN